MSDNPKPKILFTMTGCPHCPSAVVKCSEGIEAGEIVHYNCTTNDEFLKAIAAGCPDIYPTLMEYTDIGDFYSACEKEGMRNGDGGTCKRIEKTKVDAILKGQ